MDVWFHWAIIDLAIELQKIKAHDQIEVFDIYKALKLPVIYENLSVITLIDIESEKPLILSCDPLERALVGKNIFGDQLQLKKLTPPQHTHT